MGWKAFIILSLLLTSNNVFGANIIRLTDFNEGTFSLRYTDKKHSQSAFQTVQVRDSYDCVDQCLYHTSCKSINYEDLGGEQNTCELVAYDRNDYDTYVDASGFKHYDTGWNSLTQIKNSYFSSSCLVPASLTCEVSDLTYLYFTSTTHCDKIYSFFKFEEGHLYHHCSGLQVCRSGSYFHLRTTCYMPDPDEYWITFRREFQQYLFFDKGCMKRSGNNFYYVTSCPYQSTATDFQFQLPQIASGNVRTTVFRGSSYSSNFWTVLSWSSYPNSYTAIGWSDDLSYPSIYYHPMIMRKQAYLKAPATGYYEFSLACRGNCVLYIGSSEPSKTLIVDRTLYGEYENCCDSYVQHANQYSSGRYLTKGTKYYLEAILVTRSSNGNLETAYKIPGTDSWTKIQARYLHRV